MRELIIVACHGNDWVGQFREALNQHSPNADVVYTYAPGRWPTGAFLDTVSNPLHARFDRFLLLQDSMTVLADPLPWFRDQWPGEGAVAWQMFPMDWDTAGQMADVESRYTSRPHRGIFGPTFYTDRDSLAKLAAADLLPAIPTCRLESCGTERAWAYAFEQAGMPVVGPTWNVQAMTTIGVGPLRKVFANRP